MTAQSNRISVAFMALILAMLPAVLDQTILATALPTVARDLGGLGDVSWVVSAYVVAATALTPLWGKLADRHGHRRLLQLALTVFLAGSALSGLAHSITELIVFRAAQGVGAGGLMTLAMTAVGDLVAPRERGRYQGYIAMAFAGAGVLGPLAGGLLVDHVSWRWVFYVNLPLGAAALAVLSATLPRGAPEGPRAPLDVLGATLVAGATGALLLVCLWGGSRYAWGSVEILGLAAATVGLGVALVARERRAEDPVVPVALLRTPAIGIASLALFLGTAALFAVTVFVPVFLQAATGASPTGAGLLMLPMMAGITVSTTLAGRAIARTGRYKRYPLAGLGLMAAALALLAALATARSAVATGAGLLVFGLGFGMVTQVLVVAVQNAVDRRELGTATATTGFFRALGGAVGAAVLGAVFVARAGAHPAGVAAVADGVRTVLVVAAPLAVLALLAVARLPELPLRTR
jgi:EmrB/QacA subfamily drug resistance transporter